MSYYGMLQPLQQMIPISWFCAFSPLLKPPRAVLRGKSVGRAATTDHGLGGEKCTAPISVPTQTLILVSLVWPQSCDFLADGKIAMG